MSKIFFISLILILTFSTCRENNSQKKKNISNMEYLKIGEEAIQQTQKKLIENLQKALKENQFSKAIEFCNENAISLTNSNLNPEIKQISRLSDKNRNENNTLSGKDLQIFQVFKENHLLKKQIQPHLDNEGEEKVLYKPILLGLPLCLNCHGSAKDRNKEAEMAIKKKYPKDKAIDYQLGEIRGLWKVRFASEYK